MSETKVVEAREKALRECWATYLRHAPPEDLSILRAHRLGDRESNFSSCKVQLNIEMPTEENLAQIEIEIQRRANDKAKAEAPKFDIGARVSVLFDSHWRRQAYADSQAWEVEDDSLLRNNLEGKNGFVSSVFLGKVLGERPKYGVSTCHDGIRDGGFYIFEEYDLEACALPTSHRLRTIRAVDLAIGLRVRIATEGPLQDKMATITGLGTDKAYNRNLVQITLDEDFVLGRVWAYWRIELEPFKAEIESVSDKPTSGGNDV